VHCFKFLLHFCQAQTELFGLFFSCILAFSDTVLERSGDKEYKFLARATSNIFVGIYTSFACVVIATSLLWVKHGFYSAVYYYLKSFFYCIVLYSFFRFLLLERFISPGNWSETKIILGRLGTRKNKLSDKIIYGCIFIIFCSYFRLAFFNGGNALPSCFYLSLQILLSILSLTISKLLDTPDYRGINLQALFANALSCWCVLIVEIIGLEIVSELDWYEKLTWRYTTPFFSCWSGFNDLMIIIGKQLHKGNYFSALLNLFLNLLVGWLFTLALKQLFRNLPQLLIPD